MAVENDDRARGGTMDPNPDLDNFKEEEAVDAPNDEQAPHKDMLVIPEWALTDQL